MNVTEGLGISENGNGKGEKHRVNSHSGTTQMPYGTDGTVC